ncbi:uncharacterized protein TNCV_2846931 [Trichonephila clavipes]|nr:uncharacterized protein TNCV_2846931 [Trichonephila clavipes]
MDIDKVEHQMDKASSHTSKSIAAYLAKKESETGIKCIPFDEISVKSHDASPTDFCAFGLLKRALGKRHPRTPRTDFGKQFKGKGIRLTRQYFYFHGKFKLEHLSKIRAIRKKQIVTFIDKKYLLKSFP